MIYFAFFLFLLAFYLGFTYKIYVTDEMAAAEQAEPKRPLQQDCILKTHREAKHRILEKDKRNKGQAFYRKERR